MRVIPEFESKIQGLPICRNYSIHKVLLAPEALREAEYFYLIVTSKELLFV